MFYGLADSNNLNYITYTGAGYVNTDVQLVNEEDASAYVVKENTDGSVSLVISDVTNDLDADVLDINDQALSVRYYAGIDPYYSAKKAYLVPNQENNGEILLSLFLEEEKVGVSLAAKSGHFTFEAENGGFVNVNDKNEGVIAISTEAGEDLTFWLDTTDSEKIIPSFYISKGGKFLYNATDSANVNKLEVNPYRLASGEPKAIFKAGTLVSSDTLSVTVDNKKATVAKEADQNKGILGGLNSFKYQVVKPNDIEDNYVVRNANTSYYLTNINGMLAFTPSKDQALRVIVEGAAAPTSNEGVSATEVKVVAQDGAVVVKNAAGKNVVVSTILGQVVANEVLTSDNATINVPAGIVVVAVEGESFKVNVK